MPNILVGFETPELRPARDDNYVMVLSAFWRLFQASSTANFSIESMAAYHKAFNLSCELSWFIDAIQLTERIRRTMPKSVTI